MELQLDQTPHMKLIHMRHISKRSKRVKRCLKVKVRNKVSGGREGGGFVEQF